MKKSLTLLSVLTKMTERNMFHDCACTLVDIQLGHLIGFDMGKGERVYVISGYYCMVNVVLFFLCQEM